MPRATGDTGVAREDVMKAQAMTDNRVRTYAGESKRGMGDCLAIILMVAACTQLFACAGSSKPVTTQTITSNEGNFKRPLILSGSPDRDAAAYTASEEQLTSADWQALEKLGPRPIWEQLRLKHEHCNRKVRSVAA